MNNSKTLTDNYLEYCIQQKRLDEKTLKAYRIDLRQFFESIATPNVLDITSYTLESYIVINKVSARIMANIIIQNIIKKICISRKLLNVLAKH